MQDKYINFENLSENEQKIISDIIFEYENPEDFEPMCHLWYVNKSDITNYYSITRALWETPRYFSAIEDLIVWLNIYLKPIRSK